MKFIIKLAPLINCLLFNQINIISLFTEENTVNRYNIDIKNTTSFYRISNNVFINKNITYLFYFYLNQDTYIENGTIEITKLNWFSNEIVYASEILPLCNEFSILLR